MKTIKRIIQFLKGKNVYLQDFDNKVKEICIREGRSYWSVEIQLTTFGVDKHRIEDEKKVVYRCYIPDFSWQEGKTPTEAISKMEESISSRKSEPKPQVENIIL
jgi:hypothetical protein